MSFKNEELARRHTGEAQQVDPTLDSENSSLYDDDEKQLVNPLNRYQRQADFLPS
jgi:hypothetical protein